MAELEPIPFLDLVRHMWREVAASEAICGPVVTEGPKVPEGRRTSGAPGRLCGLLIAVLGLLASGAEAETVSAFDEVGRFYVQNFAPEDYGAHAQNWAIAQSPKGLIYVANGTGVLEYDGVSWRLIRVANRSATVSLAVDSSGRVYVGAVGELGYLAPDTEGGLAYVSLLDQIPEEDRDFRQVWRTFALSEGTYFHTQRRIFRWRDGRMKVWKPEQGVFFNIFAVRDALYVQVAKQGLMRMAGDVLRPAPGAASFATQSIFSLAPHGEDSYLVVTWSQGLFRCPSSSQSEETCAPFSPGLTALLRDLGPYRATTLPGGLIAIGTTKGGVVLLDQEGRLLRILDEASGLRNALVWSVFRDREDGLWLGLNDGLARVEVTAPVSYFDKTTGLLEAASAVARHRGRLYAATSRGIHVMEPAGGGAAARFAPHLEYRGQCWSLLPTPEGLLFGCDAVYDAAGQPLYRQATVGVGAMHRSRRDPALIYLGLSDGLARLRRSEGRWQDAGRIDGVSQSVRSIAEDDAGRLWLGTTAAGVLRLTPAPDPRAAPAVSLFHSEHGLPSGWVDALTLGGRAAFRTEDGLYRPEDPAGDPVRIVPDTTFDAFLPEGSASIQRLAEDEEGRVWISAGPASGVAHPQPGGGYTWEGTALGLAPPSDVYMVYKEPGGPLWQGSPRGLVRLDAGRPFDPVIDYPVWIRRVTSGDDTRLFDGQGTATGAGKTPPAAWPDRHNALRFTFAAPRYAAPERTRYRTRLEGFEDDWSAWTDETDKDYTNLWEGRYVFRVQARDVYGVDSREDRFAFHILPPWYRSWWAYALYGLALAGVVLAYVRSHRQELRRERDISRRLREVDKLKDEFLANTSHELRTPLYGITGLAESLIDGARGELPGPAKADLSMLVHSGRRLTALVADILDFSKLRHHSLELDRRPVDLRPLVDVVLTLSRPLVGSKKLELENAVAADLPTVLADENRLQQILHNLVGNAVKFTETGTVEVSAAATQAEDEQAKIVVAVRDTGIGVPMDQQERIFEAFAQADGGIEREFGGTGLGLAVTRQLIDLHGGSLCVESTPGEGSTFLFDLPIAGEPAGALDTRPLVSRPSGIEATPPAAAVELTETTDASTDDGASAPISDDANLLVVDDEPVIRQLVANQLSARGFRVTSAASGPEALRLIAERTPDLVILDVMMPRMSGFEVCRKLRERWSLEELPVIFLTAKNQAEDLVVGLAAGANDYLPKPVSKSELLARVRTHLALLLVNRQLAGMVDERTSQLAERERLLGERERLISELEARNAELARFNYTVAHDLKNPLVTIKNFLGLARRDAASERTDRLETDLDRLDAAADQLQRLLDELFELSRVGVQANPPEAVALGELVREALAELAEPIAVRGVEVEVAADLPEVTGDRPRLHEAMRHLLGNAIQYLGDQPAPRIEVGARSPEAPGEPQVVYVRDNGIGIEPQYHEKIFGLFERLDPEGSEGTGIGLALVKRIVEVHGGRIWVESEGAGRGSTFRFTLPAKKRRMTGWKEDQRRLQP